MPRIDSDTKPESVSEAQADEHMCDWEAVEKRKKHPALQEAWERYKTVWQLCVTDND